jgi:hypothetical protein
MSNLAMENKEPHLVGGPFDGRPVSAMATEYTVGLIFNHPTGDLASCYLRFPQADCKFEVDGNFHFWQTGPVDEMTGKKETLT